MGFRNILVTGAHGQLGQEMVQYLRAKGYNVTGVGRDQLDLLATPETITEKMSLFEPQIIVNCAAYTDVDKSEANPELAMAINRDGVQKLALAAKDLDAIMVHISTDYVFDGKKDAPYTTSDKPNPLGTYGKSKYYGELALSEVLDTSYIIRVSWLYGIHKKNFVQFVLDGIRQGREVRAIDDQIGAPSWVGSLSPLIERVMTSGAYGIYHACDQGAINRYDQAVRVAQMAGLSADCITRVDSRELGFVAPRPVYSVMDCGELPVTPWETAFHAYLEQYMNN